MENSKKEILTYREAVQTIKKAILQSRYKTATNANTDLLSLYYSVGRYISDNTRSGKWGTGAIKAISAQLQGEIPGLNGFSTSNMKNMRIFYEQWVHELETNRQTVSTDLDNENRSALIRQTVSAELNDDKALAFCRVSFSHHIEILRKC